MPIVNSVVRNLYAVIAACACALSGRAAFAQEFVGPPRGSGELRFLSTESPPFALEEEGPVLPGFVGGEPASYAIEETEDALHAPEEIGPRPLIEANEPLRQFANDEPEYESDLDLEGGAESEFIPAPLDEARSGLFRRRRMSRVQFPRWDRFYSRFLTPPIDGRHRGLGNPLERESWLNRPYHFDAFVGGLFADDPIDGRLKAGDGVLAGVRLGWDWHPFWGMEARFARSTTPLEHPQQIRNLGDMRFYFFDINLLYYPLGDAQWRPYMGLGLGLTDVDLQNDLDERVHETAFSVPWAWGVKYRYNDRLAFRFDMVVDFAATAGNRLDGTTNFGMTGGIEYHFGGGTRRGYYPWNPSRHWW